jgi:hypothetical protein
LHRPVRGHWQFVPIFAGRKIRIDESFVDAFWARREMENPIRRSNFESTAFRSQSARFGNRETARAWRASAND